MSNAAKHLQDIYAGMLAHFGPQNWWPAETPFEVCVGAILTQNTSWTNVEKAIGNLKAAGLMEFKSLLAAADAHICELIRPAGYFNLKTQRLRSFLRTVSEQYGDFAELFSLDARALREFLLSIRGIGPETADSMSLYAFGKPVFVVDTYTKRILMRHRLIDEDADYFRLQEFFESHMEADPQVFNEYHALLVKVGHQLCRKSGPRCEDCPLNQINGGPVLEDGVLAKTSSA